MEVYIILAKTVSTDLYKNKKSIIFADRFFFVNLKGIKMNGQHWRRTQR